MEKAYAFIENLQTHIPTIPENSILSQTVLDEAQVKVILFGFAAGQELSEHTAAYPAMLYFVDGDAQITLGQDKMRAQTGTWVHMQPNLPHSIHAQTAVTMLLILLRS